MPVLQVGGQSQRLSFAQDTTVYNPSPTVSILVGNLTPDTPIAPGGAFVLAGGRAYFVATADGSVVSVDLLQGLQGVIPSPGQIAAALITAGLAKDITLAATTTAVNTVDTTLGSPAQNTTTVNPNPYLFGGSSAGYTAINASEAITSNPAPGCPAAYALAITPNGASTVPQFTGGVFPVIPNNFYMARGAMCLPFTDANITGVQIGIAWFSDTAGSVQISSSAVTVQTPAANQWVWLNSGQPGYQAPSTAKSARIFMLIIGTANVAAADVWQATAMPVFTNLPGAPAQDSTIAHMHDRIANTGVPLTVLSQALAASTPINIVSPGTQNLGPFSFNQIGYSVYISLTSSTANLIPVKVTLTWSDSHLGGNPVGVEEWQFFPGASGVSNVVQGHGRTKGDTLNISVACMSGVGTVTGTISLAQNSRVYSRDDWRNNTLVPSVGIGVANPDLPNGILARGSPLIGTNNTSNFLLPLYCGLVQLLFGSTSLLADAVYAISCPTLPAGVFAIPAQGVNAANKVGTPIPIPIYLPRSQCELAVTNTNAANQNVDFFITMAEQTT